MVGRHKKRHPAPQHHKATHSRKKHVGHVKHVDHVKKEGRGASPRRHKHK